MNNISTQSSSIKYAEIRIDFSKNFPLTIYGDSISGRKTRKLPLSEVISAEDLPMLINQIEEILAGARTVLQTHSRIEIDGIFHWFLIRCEFRKERFGKTHLDGFAFDVSSYLDFADEDRVLLEYKRKETEKADRINDHKLTLVDILDKDYLRQILLPLEEGGVMSAIYDPEGSVICSSKGTESFVNPAKRFKHSKRVNIRINHIVVAYWIIFADSAHLIEKNSPLLDVLLQSVTRTANSFTMLYNEMSNAEHANRLLGEHIEQQILTNNVYNIILEKKDSGEALGAVAKLVGEYMGMKRICVYGDFPAEKAVKLHYEWCSHECSGTADPQETYSYSDISKVLGHLDYSDMYIPVNCESSGFAGDICTFANLNGDGKRFGIMTFDPLETGYIPTAQESKVLRSVSQITATLLLQRQADEKLKEKDEKLLRLAFYDPLLDIPNRAMLDKDLENEMGSKNSGAAAVVKITNLHTFNELFGHEYTDSLLRDVAKYIADMPLDKLDIPDENLTVYRFEGNTLMFLLRKAGEESARRVTEALLYRFGKPWRQQQGEHFLDAGIGVTMYPNGHGSRDEIYRAAALALYKATEYGANSYAFHSEAFNTEADENYRHAGKLRDAINNGMKGFTIKYQPVHNLYGAIGHDILHYEALISRDGIPTPKLISLAENMGLDIIIDSWMLRNACQFCKNMQQQDPDFRVSVNITPRTLRSGSVISMTEEALKESGLDGSSLTLELPERAFSERQDGIPAVLQKLSLTQAKLVIDSFGSDFGGLKLLKHSHMSMVKMDYSLFTNIFDDFDKTWVATVTKLTSSLPYGICVKRVEDPEQLEEAKKFGVKYAQGHMYSKPVTGEELAKRLQKTVKQK